MGIVVLTREGIEHRYLVGQIIEALDPRVDAILVSHAAPTSAWQRFRSYKRRYTTAQICSRVVARTYQRLSGQAARSEETCRRLLFPQGDPGHMPGGQKVRSVPSHNGSEALALLRELEPEVIAIYGTEIIRAPVIRTARHAMLNMHTGISPQYRGASSVFWALHNEEPEWVGVTIHVVDEGVDSGPILRIGRPVIEADDDEFSLFGKCVRIGAPLYVDALREALAGPVDGTPQDLVIGQNYRFVDRTLAAERRVRRLLRRGLLRDYTARQI